MATSTSGESPGVWISVEEKLIWKPETPAREPAGARISAGKSGSVAMSLPKTAAARVNCDPVTCMPSPESPAKRMVTRSSSRTGRLACCSVSVVTRRRAPGGHDPADAAEGRCLESVARCPAQAPAARRGRRPGAPAPPSRGMPDRPGGDDRCPLASGGDPRDPDRPFDAPLGAGHGRAARADLGVRLRFRGPLRQAAVRGRPGGPRAAGLALRHGRPGELGLPAGGRTDARVAAAPHPQTRRRPPPAGDPLRRQQLHLHRGPRGGAHLVELDHRLPLPGHRGRHGPAPRAATGGPASLAGPGTLPARRGPRPGGHPGGRDAPAVGPRAGLRQPGHLRHLDRLPVTGRGRPSTDQ